MKGRKGWVNDGGVRVPLFMQWKGHLPENRIISTTAAHIDILPTLVSLMGLDFSSRREIHGRDLAGRIMGVDREEERVLYTHVNPGVEVSPLPGAVRTGEWRLVIQPGGSPELTRKSDAGEARNLADSLPGLADSLETLYREWFMPFRSLEIPPIPAGVSDSVVLPAHEGFLSGKARYRWSASGWSNDWVTGLDGENSFIEWPLMVYGSGNYKCFAKYTSPNGETLLTVRTGRDRLEEKLPSFMPVSDPDFSRIDRAAEAIGQTWGRGEIGTVRLPAGKQTITLGASRGDTEILSLVLVRESP
jgi:arylsulfatase A